MELDFSGFNPNPDDDEKNQQVGPKLDFSQFSPRPDAEPDTIDWAGQQVSKDKIREVAAANNTTPESIARLGTWQGRLESRLAKSAVGQTALRMEQSLSDLPSAGISLLSEAGLVPQAWGENARREQKQRDDFLSFVEKGGDLEDVLGERGSRLYSGAVRSMGKMAVVGPAGATAVMSTVAADSFNDGLQEAKEYKLKGLDSTSYALNKALIETGTTFLMGRLGKSLGISSMEETLSPAMKKAVQNHVSKSGILQKIQKVMQSSPRLEALAGAKMEAAEEVLIDSLHQMNESAQTGAKFNLGRTVEAGLSGLMGTSLAKSGTRLANGINKVVNDTNMKQLVKGVSTAETLVTMGDASKLESVGDKISSKEYADLTGNKKSSATERQAFLDAVDHHKTAVADAQAEAEAKKAATEQVDNGSPESAPAENQAPNSPPESSPEANPTSGTDSTKGPQDANTEPTAGGDENAQSGEAYFAAKKEFLDQYGKELRIWRGDKEPTEHMIQPLMEAKAKGMDRYGVSIAKSVNETGRQATRAETAAMVMRGADLRKQRESLKTDMKGMTDPVQAAQLSNEYDQLQADSETIVTALNKAGSEAGRDLNYRKLAVTPDYDLATMVVKAIGKKGGPLDATERAKFDKLADTHKDVQAKADKADADFNDKVKKMRHREVSRLEGAVNSIRKKLGLDGKTDLNTSVPGLTDADKAELAKINDRLNDAKKYLGESRIKDSETDFVHNRPSEYDVSQLDDAIAEFKRKMKTKPSSSKVEARKTKQVLKRLEEAQKELNNARAGIIKERPRVYDVASKERHDAQFELKKVRDQIQEEYYNLQPKTWKHHAAEGDNLLRSAVSGYDLGYLGRQAKPAVLAHPSLVKNSLGDAIKAWSDPGKAFHAMQQIKERAYAPYYDKAGIAFESLDGELSQRNELFLSNLLNREIKSKALPTLGKAADYYRKGLVGSQRAHVAALNRVRADWFDTIVDNNGGPGAFTNDELKAIGHFVNVGTGRGDMKLLEKHMATISHLVWAPRFGLSRVQWALGQPGWQTSNKVRKVMLKEYAKSLAGGALWYSLLSAAYGGEEGFEIGKDPDSPDFGKIRVGKVTIDPMAGFSQWYRFARAINPFNDKTPRQREEAIKRFARGKASPGVGLAANVLTGSDMVGTNTDIRTVEGLGNVLKDVTVPITFRDLVPAIKELGLPMAAVATMHDFFGEGAQMYDKPGQKASSAPPWAKRKKRPWD